MYRPNAFAQDDPTALAALIAAHPLATLVAHTAAGLTADLLPLHFDPQPTAEAPHCTLRVVEDGGWLHALVQRLTDVHEGARTQPRAVSDAPPDYIAQMLRAIVGIEIAVTRLEGKRKLSQNRTDPDRLGVADGLVTEPGGGTLAALVRGGPTRAPR